MDPSIVLRVVFLILSIGIVVGGVGGIGFLLGRLLTPSAPPPVFPPDYDRRLRLLEQELGWTQAEIERLRDERDALRRLNPGDASEPPLTRDAA